MGKSTPDDRTVRRQQLDDDESASVDPAQADRLRQSQSGASGHKETSGSVVGKDQRAKGTQEEITGSDEVQDKLDEAIADSFPASDPVSIATSQHEEDWGPGAQSQPAEPPKKGRKEQRGDSSRR